jgi:hypothetical protein
MSHHLFGDGTFGDLDTELQQFAMMRGTSQRGLLRLSIRIRSRTSLAAPWGHPACPGGFATFKTNENPCDAKR